MRDLFRFIIHTHTCFEPFLVLFSTTLTVAIVVNECIAVIYSVVTTLHQGTVHLHSDTRITHIYL